MPYNSAQNAKPNKLSHFYSLQTYLKPAEYVLTQPHSRIHECGERLAELKNLWEIHSISVDSYAPTEAKVVLE